jgi:aspartokinase
MSNPLAEQLAVVVAAKITDLLIREVRNLICSSEKNRQSEHEQLLERLSSMEAKIKNLYENCPYTRSMR